MEKDYWNWHWVKSLINNSGERWFYHEREVRWCSMGLNIGFEIDGKGRRYRRPVLILKGFSREVCFCVPITSQNKTGKYYYDIDLKDGVVRKAVLSQIRTIDTKRLRDKLGTLDRGQFAGIKKAIIALIA